MTECIFCSLAVQKQLFLYENSYFYAVPDLFPKAKGHSLVIYKKHCENMFDLPKDKGNALVDAIQETKKILDAKYVPEAYNVGSNNGKVAGQVVMHFHVHLIPRYEGDSGKKRVQML